MCAKRDRIEKFIEEFKELCHVNSVDHHNAQVELVDNFMRNSTLLLFDKMKQAQEENDALQVGIEVWRKKYLDNIRAMGYLHDE